MARSVIQIRNLTKKYKTLTAVDRLTFEVQQGEIFGLIGPNGAGKTTTIECLLGTKAYDLGNITVLGLKVEENRKKLFLQVGVQFQSNYYPDRIKVKEMCKLVAALYPEVQDFRVLLKEFSLETKENNLVSSLSGGERQKLSVLLAMLHQPKLLILDELTTGLDPKARREVWKFLLDLKAKGISILLTSHFMDEVETLCDHVLILQKGKEVIRGTSEEIVKASGKRSLEDAYLFFVDAKEEEDEELNGVV